jgi:hypothetical protein
MSQFHVIEGGIYRHRHQRGAYGLLNGGRPNPNQIAQGGPCVLPNQPFHSHRLIGAKSGIGLEPTREQVVIRRPGMQPCHRGTGPLYQHDVTRNTLKSAERGRAGIGNATRHSLTLDGGQLDGGSCLNLFFGGTHDL